MLKKMPFGYDGVMTASLVWDGADEVRVPAELGTPRDDQMQGTAAERLSEIAGRCCYDSLGQKTSRASPAYHKHILAVGHYSTIEHFNFTVQLPWWSPALVRGLLNRPGLWVRFDKHDRPRLTMNLRTALEWRRWTEVPETSSTRARDEVMDALGTSVARLAHGLAPLIVPMPSADAQQRTALYYGELDRHAALVAPEDDHERWVSLFVKGSRGFCYDAETDVLTREGWKRWPDVVGDEEFATLEPESGRLVYQRASAVVREPYHGKMYRVASQCVNIFVTPNHRMFVRLHDTQAARRGEERFGILSAEEVAGRRVHYKRTARWEGVTPKWFDVEDVVFRAPVANQTGARTVVCHGRRVDAMAFARFVGYWLAEGHLDHTPGSGYTVVLTQKKDGRAWAGMRAALDVLGWAYSVDESAPCQRFRVSGGKALYDFFVPYDGAANKGVPSPLREWAAPFQRALIESYLEGDGSFGAGRHAGEGHTVSLQLAGDLQEAALKAGWSASIRVVDRRNDPPRAGKWAAIRHRKIGYVVGFSKLRGAEPLVNHGGKKHDSWERYSGIVYCATVPNGTLYVRRGGKPCWSGNSHELVRHGDYTAISQRSTRFVDESESPWVLHPLRTAFLADEAIPADVRAVGVELLEKTVSTARASYSWWAERLIEWLAKRGVDSTSARKQARGASRGDLGNGLETELIFSMSVAQARHILKMRAANAADAEIRAVVVAAIPALKACRYGESFADVILEPASDGLGLALAGGGAK